VLDPVAHHHITRTILCFLCLTSFFRWNHQHQPRVTFRLFQNHQSLSHFIVNMCRPDYTKDAAARSSASIQKCELSKDDEWLTKFDFTSFSEEIRALGKKLEMEQGPADVTHLNKMITWSNSFAAIGLLTMGFAINPISVVCLSLYTFSRWTMIAHHVCHGGYEKCHPNKSRWSRFKFGLGSLWRRFNDWFDWIMPEAWNVEHNTR
jgi:hypothetical protein